MLVLLFASSAIFEKDEPDAIFAAPLRRDWAARLAVDVCRRAVVKPEARCRGSSSNHRVESSSVGTTLLVAVAS